MSDVQVMLTASGSGTVTIGGVATPLRGAGLEAAREMVRQLVAAQARQAGRAMVMDVAEPGAQLAQTGVNAELGAALAAGLVALGGGVLLARRRMA